MLILEFSQKTEERKMRSQVQPYLQTKMQTPAEAISRRVRSFDRSVWKQSSLKSNRNFWTVTIDNDHLLLKLHLSNCSVKLPWTTITVGNWFLIFMEKLSAAGRSISGTWSSNLLRKTVQCGFCAAIGHDKSHNLVWIFSFRWPGHHCQRQTL